MSPFLSTELPGIGRRYSIELAEGEMMVVIARHTGERDLYVFAHRDDDEPKSSVTLTDEESRQLGAVLLGADYQPVAADKMQLLLQETRLSWLRVCEESPLKDVRIQDAQVRTRTGVTVIGIKRADKLIGSPGPEEILRAGDLLMVIGNSEQVKSMEKLCAIDQT